MRNFHLLLVTTPPAEPSLRPGLNADQVSPGFLGFLFTFFIVVIMFFLIRDMVKRVRRVRYRGQVEEAQRARLAAAEDGEVTEDDDGASARAGASPGGGVNTDAVDDGTSTRAGAGPSAGKNGAKSTNTDAALEKRPRIGGSHGPDADFIETRSQDDGPTDQTRPR